MTTSTVLSHAVGTWPGLCAVFVDFAAKEVYESSGKKKGPDVSIPKTLRRLVQLADDDRRSGTCTIISMTIKKRPHRFIHIGSLET